MRPMAFDETYTQYWENLQAARRTLDGSLVVEPAHADRLLSVIGVSRARRTLDLGCSTGRMVDVLRRFSDEVCGVDPDAYAVEKARAAGYADARIGTAQSTGFPAASFDLAFCWATFDIVDHYDALAEIRRVLEVGGRFVVTCKASDYQPDDARAFQAEKNAYLKGFPNHFTRLPALCAQLPALGFELEALVTFPRRGDMGELTFVEHEVAAGHMDAPSAAAGTYEYLLLGRKIETANVVSRDAVEPLDTPFSTTASQLAIAAGHDGPAGYFEALGLER